MIRGKWFPTLAGLGGLGGLVFLAVAASGESPYTNTATAIPPNFKGPQPVPPLKVRLDVRKSSIEGPLKIAVAARTAPAAPATGAFVNPKVQPGQVRWHPSFEAARAAALRSKKPVLLFQMMGKLDEQFC